MDYNEVKERLDLYLSGNSSLAEEQELREYFEREKNIPDDFLYAKELFSHFKSEKEEVYSGPIPLKRINWYRRLFLLGGVAAAFAIVFSLIQYQIAEDDNNMTYMIVNGKEIKDRRQAIQQTKEALQLITNKYSKGTQHLNALKKFNSAEKMIKSKQ